MGTENLTEGLPLKLKEKLLDAEIAKLHAETRTYEINAQFGTLNTEALRLQLETKKREDADEAASDGRRHIYTFFTDVSKTSTFKAMETLGFWSRRDPGCKIEVIFNSPGGSIIDGLAFYDFITALKENGHQVTTAAIGAAASMAGVLLQAGTVRVMGKNTYLLIHELSGGASGKMSEVEDTEAFMKRMQNRLLDILASRSKISRDKIAENWKRKDWWLDSKEALKLGFVDKIR